MTEPTKATPVQVRQAVPPGQLRWTAERDVALIEGLTQCRDHHTLHEYLEATGLFPQGSLSTIKIQRRMGVLKKMGADIPRMNPISPIHRNRYRPDIERFNKILSG